MTPVGGWTGRHTRALRRALRMSVRGFAEYLGLAPRTVAKWEALAGGITLRPDNQCILDTALQRADAEAQFRFEQLLDEPATDGTIRQLRPKPAARDNETWDYETWSDDLSRIAASLARQDFVFASRLIDRWLSQYDPRQLDDPGLYLYARSLVLLGDLQRDRGELTGLLSARETYRTSHQLFCQLQVPRRAAQVELSLAVIDEMNGELDRAALRYRDLAQDERLSVRDRTRSELWVGTALSKRGDLGAAIRVLTSATQRFEEIDEPEDWSVGHQKVALAYRGLGDLGSALRFLEVPLSQRGSDSPMQAVRLDTAHAHVLLSDPATANEGVTLLHKAADVSQQHGLAHQQRSIANILSSYQKSA